MTKRVFTGFIIVLFFALTPAFLFSVEVDWVSGNVTYSHLKGEWKDLDIGMNLAAGDIIKTGMGSEVSLREVDFEIYIQENSTFTISEKYEDGDRKSSFMLFFGRMKFKLARSGKKEPEIQTQTISLTIRGTEFEVGSGYDGSTLVLMSEGSVTVKGDKSELVLMQGEGTEVPFGEEPTEKFEVITKVIDWDKWFNTSQESIKGNEIVFLNKILVRFQAIDAKIKDFERIRAVSLKEKEVLLKKRDESKEKGNMDEASGYSKKAGEVSKKAFHSIVNIRFLALSSIGLFDMAENIYKGVEKPSGEQKDIFEKIDVIYKDIEDKYIRAGDRERIEQKAKKKKGCLKPY
ncbi:MAG TPA: hypothetical protein ENI15_14145 [Spirochaetes bacterium]|nr:hypothetical protein [Spirochaetota bacterium]